MPTSADELNNEEFTIDDFEHSYPQWTRRSYYQNKRCEEYVEYIKNELGKQGVNLDDEFPKPFVPLTITLYRAARFALVLVGVVIAAGALIGIAYAGTPAAAFAVMLTAAYLIPAGFIGACATFFHVRQNYKSDLKTFGTYPPNKLLALAEKYNIKKPPSIPQTSVNSEYDATDIRRSSSTARSSNPYPKLKEVFDGFGTTLEQALKVIIDNPVTKDTAYGSQTAKLLDVKNKLNSAIRSQNCTREREEYQALNKNGGDIQSLLCQEVLTKRGKDELKNFTTLSGEKFDLNKVLSQYLNPKTKEEQDQAKTKLSAAVKTISQQNKSSRTNKRGAQR
jgi:hypothetical protein